MSPETCGFSFQSSYLSVGSTGQLVVPLQATLPCFPPTSLLLCWTPRPPDPFSAPLHNLGNLFQPRDLEKNCISTTKKDSQMYIFPELQIPT